MSSPRGYHGSYRAAAHHVMHLAAGMTLALLLAACGNSSKQSGTSPSAVSGASNATASTAAPAAAPTPAVAAPIVTVPPPVGGSGTAAGSGDLASLLGILGTLTGGGSGSGGISATQITALVQSPIGQQAIQMVLSQPQVQQALASAGLGSAATPQNITTLLENPQVAALLSTGLASLLSSSSGLSGLQSVIGQLATGTASGTTGAAVTGNATGTLALTGH